VAEIKGLSGGALIDAFFVPPKLPMNDVPLCRPSPQGDQLSSEILIVFLFRKSK
jgi:hypothetical protein